MQTNHPYPLRASCGDLFNTEGTQLATSAYSSANCKAAIGPEWFADPDAADALVDYAETALEVALICCSVGGLTRCGC